MQKTTGVLAVQAPRQIYDFGMHIADDTEVYLKKGFRVVAVEADPALCEAAGERFATEIAGGRLVILNKAIGEREGTFDFYLCNEQDRLSTASLDVVKEQSRNGVTFRTVKVEFTTATELLCEYGEARFAKIDIEGHDLMCLKQIALSGVPLDYLSFEVDFLAYDQALATCLNMGFERFALVPQRPIGGTRAVSPSREGRSIEHLFEIGQSGPFGDDLKTKWQSAASVARQCFAIRVQSKLHGLMSRLRLSALASRLFPDTQTWYDIHAGRLGAKYGQ